MTPSSMISQEEIENRIFTIRGQQVMIDRDLGEVYCVDTKVLNQAVKRNLERFPDSFRFQLSEEEKNELVTNCDQFNKLKHSTSNPFAFTEQGVAMLSAVLRSETAIRVSIQIIKTFVALRKITAENQLLFKRLEKVELKQLETDQKFDRIFKALESKEHIPNQGVFFEGEVFDAYELTSRIIRSAKSSIILIDNYINETTLTHLSKKNQGVKTILFTKTISKQIDLDILKANEQYGGFEAKVFEKSHDRFLIIDQEEIYHLGASLKDLGKKWFAFSRLEKKSVKSLIDSLPF
ncbi:MAG: ORF6N domain-containing protein [Algoriphagus sp.]|nr:ORF6N domain-containing protein [Algoriphagus sp.]